jgi:hypothetical protein
MIGLMIPTEKALSFNGIKIERSRLLTNLD